MVRGRLSRFGALVAALFLQGGVLADPVHKAPILDAAKSCIKPQYPMAARRAGQQGTVTLKFLIGSDGLPLQSEVATSSGSPELDKAAQDALVLCHFKPAEIDGQPDPQPQWAQIRYSWKLQEPAPGAPVMPGGGTTFSLKCSAKPSVDDFADQLAQITAIDKATRLGGVARVVLPPRGGVQENACLESYYRAEIEALKRFGLFDKVESAETGIEGVRPQAGSEDYTLWIQGRQMVVAYHGGPRAGLGNSPQGLAIWVKSLPTNINTARTWQESRNFTVGMNWIDNQPYYALHGKEYRSTADIELGARAEAAAEVKALTASGEEPIGRRARIVLAPEASMIFRGEAVTVAMVAQMDKSKAPGMINLVAGSQLALRVAAYAVAQEWAPAVRQAGLFKEIDIDELDAPDPMLSGYETVIWDDPTSPFKWKVRDSKGVLHEVPQADTAAQWIANLRTVLTEAKSAP